MKPGFKSYYLAITILAIIGIASYFSNWPILLGFICFCLGVGYKEYIKDEKENEGSPDLLDDYY